MALLSGMSSLRCLTAATRRAAVLVTPRAAYSHEHPENMVPPHEGKVVSPHVSMPDPLGHSVGKNRFEQLSKLAGHPDPFEQQIWQAGEGSKQNPTLIPSNNWQRVIGHICEPDALVVAYINLHKGEKKRCDCGHWFALVDDTTIDAGIAHPMPEHMLHH